MKRIIIYYSKNENNTHLAGIIEKELQCVSERITETRRRSALGLFLGMMRKKLPQINQIVSDLNKYDHVILIAPVWGGVPAPAMIAFINENAGRIRKYSFISLCGGSLGPNKRLLAFLQDKLGKKPKAFAELYVNDTAPAEKKDKPFKVMKIRLGREEIQKNFKDQIAKFIAGFK